jgi:hypothetical protein
MRKGIALLLLLVAITPQANIDSTANKQERPWRDDFVYNPNYEYYEIIDEDYDLPRIEDTTCEDIIFLVICDETKELLSIAHINNKDIFLNDPNLWNYATFYDVYEENLVSRLSN